MKDSITIYWGSKIRLNHNELSIIEPVSLIKEMHSNMSKENLDNFSIAETSNYFRCPAAKKENNNIFVIKSPRDFSFKWDPKTNEYYSKHLKTPEKLYSFLTSRGKLMASLGFWYYFFTNQNIEMSQLPAYYSDNDFTKSTFLPSGKFNISKWFRSIDPTFIMKKNEINIKRGDALFYVKFHTDKKVILKNFIVNSKLTKFHKNTAEFKLHILGFSLEKLYRIFLSKNYNKRILKEIKNNLSGY